MGMLKKGAFVTFGDKKDKKYGRITAVDESAKTYDIRDADDTIVSGVAEAEVKASYAARVSMRSGSNFREVAENVVAMSIYNPLIAGRSVTGPENISFAIADTVHEFLLKPATSGWAEFLSETVLKEEDAEKGFATSDFTDPFRKLPFVAVLQQLTQKMIFKKQFSHGIMHNLIGGYVSMAVSNFADRMFQGVDEKRDNTYRYP